MSDRVTIDLKAGVADVRLNRPEKMNALDPAMFAALAEVGSELARTPGLRAVALTGEGRGFCAGLDMASFAAMSDGKRREGSAASQKKERAGGGLLDEGTAGPANFAQSAAWIWRTLPVPVIAGIHGVAYGGGLQIALGADVRVVAPDARLSVMEIKWGLVPDMSGTQTLRHLVRDDVARELTYTGRIVSGEEARELGLATQVDPNPQQAAYDMAMEIASKSPDAIRADKELLNAASMVSLEEGLQLEASLQASLIGRPNQVEAVKANMEKRAPAFADSEE
ncbi:MAG: crotonase/enoyl-CoA hydratase family protein [Myxococcota bacterium]|nr:crotonase/enoyl-CoA hydratase family protein [Myxococcota bacterium]